MIFKLSLELLNNGVELQLKLLNLGNLKINEARIN